MHWEIYRAWCEKTGQPVMVQPQGLREVGDHIYCDDGFLYIRQKQIGRYLTLRRYSGLDILLKLTDVDNAKRFEALRWKLLNHIQALNERHGALRDKIYDLRGRGPKRKAVHAHCMYEGELCVLEIRDDKYAGRQANGSRVRGYDSLDPLEKMSRIPRSSEEGTLTAQWFTMRDRIHRYWATSANISACLASVLHDKHPYVKEGRGRGYDCPVTFEVNGRYYPISATRTMNRDMDYWPSPMTPGLVVL